jgi:hypothetical protein
VGDVSRAWLYTRAHESVRIVVAGGAVTVYGPGAEFNHSEFPEEMDATLHHAAVEDALVRDGFSLEQLTTERRLAIDSRPEVRRLNRRRRTLRLVDGDA